MSYIWKLYPIKSKSYYENSRWVQLGEYLSNKENNVKYLRGVKLVNEWPPVNPTKVRNQ